MERFTVEHLRVSNGTVAAYCTDRRASGDDSVYSIRLWVNVRNVLPVDNAATNGLDPKLAHVIIPMLGTVVCMDLFVLQAEEAPELLILCILCASADEISRFEVQYSFTEKRVIHVDTQEQSVPAVVKTLFNIDGTRAITASMLSGRRNNGNCSIITVWSEMLRRMRVLQPADDWRESTNVGTQLGTIVDIGFGGEDHVQLVFACYTSGIIMGWDASTGDIVCIINSTTSTISALTQSPTCFYCMDTSLFVGYQDGKVKQYEVLRSGASGMRGNNANAMQRSIAEPDNGEAQWQHREKAMVDLSRELRFKGMGCNEIAATAGSLEGPGSSIAAAVTRELVLTPLSMCVIPATYSCTPSASSVVGTRSTDTRKRAGWDLPAEGKNGAKVGQSGVNGGQICIATLSGIIVLDKKASKVVHTVSLDTLQVSSLSCAACSFVAPTNTKTAGNDVHLAVVFLPAFSGTPRLFKLSLFPVNIADAAEGSAVEGDYYEASPPQAGIGYDNVTQLLGIADIAIGNAKVPRRSAVASTASNDRHSIYEDEVMPLSYFMHSSMLPDRCEDSPREGDIPRPRSLLASPKAKAHPSTQPTVTLRRASSAAANNWETPKKDKQGKLLDQPITFQRNIKSSGYGQIPQDSYERKKFFQQQDAQKKAAAASKALQRSLSAPRGGGGRSTTGGDGGGAEDGASSAAAPRGAHIRAYPLDCLPMQCHQAENDISTAFPVRNISFSKDGSLLGVATADSAVITVRLPASKYGREVVSYAGHNSRINNVSFTHSKYVGSSCGSSGAASYTTPATKTIRLLPQQSQPHYQMLSCSADGTARMWRHGQTDGAAVVFSHMKHSVGSVALVPTSTVTGIGGAKAASFTSSTKRTSIGAGKAAEMTGGGAGNSSVSTYSAGPAQAPSKEARNRPFGDEVTYASYFYMDKFAVLASKASVLMYRYNMHSEDANDDLKRTLALGSYQLAHQWDLSVHAQSVCAVSCINSTPSPVIFCATSDKFLNILDASTGTIARAVESPHTRNIHCIALPRPSLHVPLSPDAYNLFLTSAVDNNINMWDLRAPSAVNRYNSHVNKREPVGCDISPCLRYIATGSEDKSCVIYDVRTGKVLSKLMGHKDVVNTVAFNPLFPQLATGSYDGTVKFYVDPTFDAVPL